MAAVFGAGLNATISKAAAALLWWLGLALGLGWASREAATTAFLLLRRLLRRNASTGDTVPWPELPPELLGLVLSRLPSRADRARLRAVCRPWRSAPRPQPLPPLLPWLVLCDDTFLTLHDGAVHRMPLDGSSNIAFLVSTGSMLFLAQRCGSCCLMNPSSGETIPLQINIADLQIHLSCYIPDMIQKVVVTDHIIAFLIKGKVKIIIRRPPQPRGEKWCPLMVWTPPVNTHEAVDIALFQGKLFVLTAESNCIGLRPLELLHLLDIVDEQNLITSVQCICSTPRNGTARCLTRRFFFYLVASGDRLLMVTQQIDKVSPHFFHLSPLVIEFEVLEAVDLIGGHGRWNKVDTLLGHALFVSPGCSELLPAQCGAQEDCIYYMTEHNELRREGDLVKCIVYVRCIEYNMRDKTMEQVTWVKSHSRWHPTWIFPS